MAKHTPGPHTVEQIGRRALMKAVSATVISPTGERLADFRHVSDANLFAAAPEILAALTNMLRAATREPADEVMGQAIEYAEAAIAKAAA